MVMIVVGKKLRKQDTTRAREEFPEYIKITADLEQKIVVIGGEYHADAEKLLLENYSSRQKDVWGGGYNVSAEAFEVNAMINVRPGTNDSPDILDPERRKLFLEVVKSKLEDIKSLL